MLLLLLIVFAYVLGSIPSAIVVCKLRGLPDPRTQGSGNPGASNVLRSSGPKIAVFVLIGDVLKGVIPVLLAKVLGVPTHLLGWVALAVFLGHLFPIFFRFRGGKGVATAIGGILVIAWPLALAAIATWLLVAVLFRYSSLSAMVAALLTPVYAYWLAPQGCFLPILIMAILILIRHRQNMINLWEGTEDKIGERA